METDINTLGLKLGQKLILRVTVEDVDRAQKLLAWLYRERAIVPVENFGCRMDSLGWHDKEAELRELLEPIKQAALQGRL